ncbi:hypothetical protein [Bacillus tuaregi]|uniref:hypothetical protein n=1 Tax=Bacillus tuaregi TaxID=1816695 RepID=UPI0008F7EEAB|nr:hypothetical protein [Bacillus tuaregi]
MEGEQRFKFFEGNGLAVLMGPFLFGVLGCTIPNWSFRIFIFNMLITIFSVGLARYWYQTVENTVRYNSLTSFIMLMTMGFFVAEPILRLSFGTMVFWPFILMYLLVIGYSLYKREMIFQAFHRPGKSKIAFGSYLFIIVLIIISAFSFRNGQELILMQLLDDQEGVFFFTFLMYLGGLFLSFLSFALLKKPEDIK